MWRRALVLSIVLLGMGTGQASFAQEKGDAIGDLKTQLNELRSTVQALQAENQRLQATLAHQQRVAAASRQGGTPYEHINLFDPSQSVELFPRAGAAPPSWLDILIEQNRQRTLEAMMRQRANERLVDERLARIGAESRAIGAAYAPRPLREGVLAGGDPKALRDQLTSARSADFDSLFSQPQVKEYFQTKVGRLEGEAAAAVAVRRGLSRVIASADVHMLARQLRQDIADTTALFGSDGHPPAGFEFGAARTRELRDSSNPQISGPTRDTLAISRRAAAVNAAVAADVDIDTVLRAQAVQDANRRILQSGYAPSPEQVASDLAQVNNVLNGKIVRTKVPEVHALQTPKAPGN